MFLKSTQLKIQYHTEKWDPRYQESYEVGDEISKDNIEEFYEGNDILVDKETYNNYNKKQQAYGLVNAGLDSMIFNFNEIICK